MRQDAECEPTWANCSLRETCFAPASAKIKEILAGFFCEAGIARAKKVFTASHKITSLRIYVLCVFVVDEKFVSELNLLPPIHNPSILLTKKHSVVRQHPYTIRVKTSIFKLIFRNISGNS